MNPDKWFSAPKIILSLTLGAVIILLTFPLQAREKITIGLIPEMNIFAQMKRFQPLADHLSRQTGIEVRLSMASSYGSMIDRLRSHKIDAAFLGSFTAAQAISQLNAIPLARALNPDNTPTYHGYVFVRKDSNIRKIEDMRGKTMAFVEQATTAGYIFPVAWLREGGVPNHTVFFNDFFFAGSHDATIDAVLNRKADIGAAKNTIYDYYRADNPRIQKELVIISRSKPIPSNALCVMPTVSMATREKLQNSLLGLDATTEGRKVLENLRVRKFVKTEPADYALVIALAKETGISLEPFRPHAN